MTHLQNQTLKTGTHLDKASSTGEKIYKIGCDGTQQWQQCRQEARGSGVQGHPQPQSNLGETKLRLSLKTKQKPGSGGGHL